MSLRSGGLICSRVWKALITSTTAVSGLAGNCNVSESAQLTVSIEGLAEILARWACLVAVAIFVFVSVL